MDQYEHVRTASRVYGHSINKISRDTGHSRNTIRKALQGEHKGYSPRQVQICPVLGSFSQIIDQWLLDDKEQPKKQRHTARRIYNRLVSEFNFDGSESNVRKFVREARVRLDIGRPQVFIPLAPDLGQEAEIDWGTATVKIGGQSVTVKMFCIRSKGSGKSFVRLYPCERQQAFFDGMMEGFAFYGGIFPILIFDNLTSAVKKVLVGKKQIEQESFSKFRAYHNFTSRFCNLGQGHEKGGVEGLLVTPAVIFWFLYRKRILSKGSMSAFGRSVLITVIIVLPASNKPSISCLNRRRNFLYLFPVFRSATSRFLIVKPTNMPRSSLIKTVIRCRSNTVVGNCAL